MRIRMRISSSAFSAPVPLLPSFFDLDQEVERHFGAPLERLKARLEAAGVLKTIYDGNQERVIALPPSWMRDAYKRLITKLGCLVVAIDFCALIERVSMVLTSRRFLASFAEARGSL